MTHADATRALLASIAIGAFLTPANCNPITAKYPWLMKAASELSHAECRGVMKHDANYWWGRGKCHMKGIRYAWGVAITDAPGLISPGTIVKKGELLTNITEYRFKDKAFCEHGGGCYLAKSIKLLGSVLTGPYYGSTDGTQGVSSSCETILADRAAIMRAKAQAMLQGCH